MTFGADWTVKPQRPFAQTGPEKPKANKQTQTIIIINLLVSWLMMNKDLVIADISS